MEPVDAVISILAVVLDSDASAHNVVGRTYELVSAYKQFGVSPQEVDRLRVVVKVPGKSEYAVFKVLALPFGHPATQFFSRLVSDLTSRENLPYLLSKIVTSLLRMFDANLTLAKVA